jgi:hypothetical protein
MRIAVLTVCYVLFWQAEAALNESVDLRASLMVTTARLDEREREMQVGVCQLEYSASYLKWRQSRPNPLAFRFAPRRSTPQARTRRGELTQTGGRLSLTGLPHHVSHCVGTRRRRWRRCTRRRRR